MTPLGFPIVRALGLAGKTAMAKEETPFEILSRHDATRRYPAFIVAEAQRPTGVPRKFR